MPSSPARAVVHAADGRAAAGGGPAWAAAVAGALARHGPAALVAPGPDVLDLDPWLAEGGPRPTVELRRPSRSRRDDLRRAWADRADRVTVVQSPHPPRLTASPRSAVLVDFPLTPVEGPLDRLRLARYRRVVANSAFTAGWVRRRWGRTALVVPPLVRPLGPGRKGPIVLSVGRFTGGSRSKGQLDLVEAFRRLDPDGRTGWELHLAGHVADPRHLDEVRAAATGLAVHLHPDCGRGELEDLYRRAALYWHACGLGADAERHPERLEHFGISVVEAMGAGAVPLVLDAGGPAETVAGVAPTWHDLDALVAESARLISSPDARGGLADRARARAEAFGPAAFAARVDDLFDQLDPARG